MTNQSQILPGVRDYYGTKESNGLANGQQYHEARHQDGPVDEVDWTEPGLRVTRLRLLSDPGFPAWDVSYCHGVIGGRHVDVLLPFSQLPKRRWKAAIVAHAKKAGVFAARLGILDNVSTLN